MERRTANTNGCESLDEGFKGGLCHSFDKFVLSTYIRGSVLQAMGYIRDE